MNSKSASGPDDSPEDPRISALRERLAAPLPDDPEQGLDALLGELALLSTLDPPASAALGLLDALRERVAALGGTIRPRLAQARLPLPRELRQCAKKLLDALGLIAGAYQRQLPADDAGEPATSPMQTTGHALRAVADRLLIAALIASPAPRGAWAQAHALYRAHAARQSAQAQDAAQPGTPDHIYREMLALAVVQPERLAASELGFACAYVERFAPVVELSNERGAQIERQVHWLDPEADAAPNAAIRRSPPSDRPLLYVSCTRLGTLVVEQLRWLENGVAPAKLHLPEESSDPRCQGLLRRLQEAWSEPRTRLLHRRRHSYRVEMCTGFQTVWKLLRDAPAEPAETSEWVVLNESPTGYAVYRVAGPIDGLSHGGVIAIRAAPARPWDIGVVRWLHAGEDGHVELGIQVVASTANAGQILFRSAQKSEMPHPALLLPSVPALRAQEAVLAPAGCCSSRRFVLVLEGSHTRIIQGRVLSFDLQTASTDLFQFQADPYPM